MSSVLSKPLPQTLRKKKSQRKPYLRLNESPDQREADPELQATHKQAEEGANKMETEPEPSPQ